MTIETTLAERGGRYGDFEQHAVISQALQDVMRAQPGWARLKPDQKQALTVMADKVARMLNGDPDYRDNWHDVVGYAKLVDDRMARDEALASAKDAGWTDDAIKAAGWTDEAIKAAALQHKLDHAQSVPGPRTEDSATTEAAECQSMAIEWPDESRIDAIGQNGNGGEHYPAGLVE